MNIKRINLNRYYNNLKIILKEKEECYQFYLDTIRLNELQKKADLKLFYKKPLIYLIRFLFFLPTNLIRMLKNINHHFYLTKLSNEIETLKYEINNFQDHSGQNN